MARHNSSLVLFNILISKIILKIEIKQQNINSKIIKKVFSLLKMVQTDKKYTDVTFKC